MHFPISHIAFAGLAFLAPFAEPAYIRDKTLPHMVDFEEAGDNCTEYSSPDAGTVCIHSPSDCSFPITAQIPFADPTGSTTYLVKADDTCNKIANLFGNFTISQFYYWNPDVGQTCFGLRAYVPVCINTPWYKFTPPVQPPAGTVDSSSLNPVPIMPNITPWCTKYELVGDGPAYSASSISAANGVTIDAFLNWNAGVSKTNPVLWSGYWVCVSVS
ncbi:LysM domain-containing protein [Lachnellula suecica]|uniref:LysM domain-containing protein n=1 Tax=Lachnellula suecica TaxID=602035 RepID=A0A8T9CF60_9HELO|nr:LysM domain-containing protein [Lachnellula suecica]